MQSQCDGDDCEGEFWGGREGWNVAWLHRSKRERMQADQASPDDRFWIMLWLHRCRALAQEVTSAALTSSRKRLLPTTSSQRLAHKRPPAYVPRAGGYDSSDFEYYWSIVTSQQLSWRHAHLRTHLLHENSWRKVFIFKKYVQTISNSDQRSAKIGQFFSSIAPFQLQ